MHFFLGQACEKASDSHVMAFMVFGAAGASAFFAFLIAFMAFMAIGILTRVK